MAVENGIGFDKQGNIIPRVKKPIPSVPTKTGPMLPLTSQSPVVNPLKTIATSANPLKTIAPTPAPVVPRTEGFKPGEWPLNDLVGGRLGKISDALGFTNRAKGDWPLMDMISGPPTATQSPTTPDKATIAPVAPAAPTVPVTQPAQPTGILRDMVNNRIDSSIPKPPAALPALPKPNLTAGTIGARAKTGIFVGGKELGRDESGGVLLPRQGAANSDEATTIAARAVSNAGISTDDPQFNGAAKVALEHAYDPNKLGLGQVRFANGQVMDQNAAVTATNMVAEARRPTIGSMTPLGGTVIGRVGDKDESGNVIERRSGTIGTMPGRRSESLAAMSNSFNNGPVSSHVLAPSRHERMALTIGDQQRQLAELNNSSAERIAGIRSDAASTLKKSEWQHESSLQDKKNQGLKDANGAQVIYDDQGNVVGMSGKGTLARPSTGTTAGDAKMFTESLKSADSDIEEANKNLAALDKLMWLNSDEKAQKASYQKLLDEAKTRKAGLLDNSIGHNAQSQAPASTASAPKTANEGQKVRGPDGKVYIIKNGVPVLAAA